MYNFQLETWWKLKLQFVLLGPEEGSRKIAET